MKINGNQIKIGNVLEHKGTLFVVTKTQAVKPGKGGAFNQVEMKSIIDNTKLNERFRSDEIVERVRIDSESFQYLYSSETELIFMNSDSYEQISLSQSMLDEKKAFLKEGMGWNFVPASLGQTINDEIIDLVRKEKISPVVGKVVDFADVPAAIEDMGNRLSVGRIIVKLF